MKDQRHVNVSSFHTPLSVHGYDGEQGVPVPGTLGTHETHEASIYMKIADAVFNARSKVTWSKDRGLDSY
jgi:hypothetical protein